MEGTDPMLSRVRAAAEPVLSAMAGSDPLDRQEVPDLLGKVVEKVLARHRGGHHIDDLERYAKEAARNAFRDWLRSKRRKSAHIHRDAATGSSTTPIFDRHIDRLDGTPSSLVVDRDDQRRHAPLIQAALESLTPTERAVLELRYVKGLPSSEVARILGYRSAGVVNTTASRARQKLNDRLPLSLMGPLLGG